MGPSELDRNSSSDWIDLARKARFRPGKLARLCGVSVRQLERYFLAVFYRPPEHWLHELRLRAARRLILQESNQKQVAATLGFANVPHFIREFKVCFGCTPKQYAVIEALRSEQRMASSPVTKALEESYRQLFLHPHDCHSLFFSHQQRKQFIDRLQVSS